MFATGFGLIFREAVGWAVGKVLDLLPLPKNAAGVVNWAAIPWLNALAFALLAVGVYLFWRGGRMRPAINAPPNPFPSLATNANIVSQNISNFRATKRVFRDMLPDFMPIFHQGLALLVSFEKNGFAVPSVESDEAERIAIAMQHYFTTIAPMLRAGHIDEAKGLSVPLAQSAEQRATTFQPNQWWTSNDFY